MRVVLFGATGMVGQGILRELLGDSEVTAVLCIGRNSSAVSHPKLRDLVYNDLTDFQPIASEFAAIDACIFAVGISITAAGPELFEKVNCTMPLAVATTLLGANPKAKFVYISADGVDPTEQSSQLWKRLRGRTENQLLALPFNQMTILRPLIILPAQGERSRTRAYRIFYAILGPLLKPFRALFPHVITTTDTLGRTAVGAAKNSAPSTILNGREINRLGAVLDR